MINVTRSVSVAIMAHPARRDLVHDLLEHLGEDVPVAYDPDRIPSRDKQRRWRVGAEAWMRYDADADWHIVLQDDVKVCDQFIDVASYLLEDQFLPIYAFSFYWGNHPPFPKLHQSDSKYRFLRPLPSHIGWMIENKLYSGLAVALPTSIIPDMVKTCSQMTLSTYDMRISKYLKKKKIPTAYRIPCAVDHLQVPSLLGHTAVRKAVSFAQDPTRAGLESQTSPRDPTASGMTPRAGGAT